MLANLRALFSRLIDIILLRRGPEFLPASSALLAFAVGAYVVLTGLVASAVATAEQKWPVELLIYIVVTLGWYRVALNLSGKRERFVQTLTALFAARAVFTPLVVPILSTIMAQSKAEVPPSMSLSLLAIFFLVWLFVINVRIVRAAFEWPWPASIIMVLAQEFAVITVFALLFGAPAKPA